MTAEVSGMQRAHLGVAALLAGVFAHSVRKGDYLLERHYNAATEDAPTGLALRAERESGPRPRESSAPYPHAGQTRWSGLDVDWAPTLVRLMHHHLSLSSCFRGLVTRIANKSLCSAWVGYITH